MRLRRMLGAPQSHRHQFVSRAVRTGMRSGMELASAPACPGWRALPVGKADSSAGVTVGLSRCRPLLMFI